MNTPVNNSQFSSVQSLKSIGQANRSLKLVIFSVGQLNVALAIDSVKKVINYTPVFSSGLTHLGMAHVDDGEITVIDLHKRLYRVSQPLESGVRGYLIVAKNSSGEVFGILVSQTPTLLDVPMSQIRALPPSYRQSDTLEIASHVTIIPQAEEKMTVFVLDADRLIPAVLA